jgi:hypothetical protein
MPVLPGFVIPVCSSYLSTYTPPTHKAGSTPACASVLIPVQRFPSALFNSDIAKGGKSLYLSPNVSSPSIGTTRLTKKQMGQKGH